MHRFASIWPIMLIKAVSLLDAQQPDDHATVRWATVTPIPETVSAVLAAFADQQLVASAVHEAARAATVEVGPFPHDPARLTTIRVSLWRDGDSTLGVAGGYFVLMQRDFVVLKESRTGATGQLWGRLLRIRDDVCRRVTCVESP